MAFLPMTTIALDDVPHLSLFEGKQRLIGSATFVAVPKKSYDPLKIRAKPDFLRMGALNVREC
jgi:hypothetical protein